jgi:hypothetical protein
MTGSRPWRTKRGPSRRSHTGLDGRDVEVGLDEVPVELGEGGVDKVLDDTNALSRALLDPGGHVHLQHSADLDALLLVRLGDGLRAEGTALLGRVPVELDGEGAVKKLTDRARKASSDEVVPEPSSSAPGAGRNGHMLVESW